MSDDRTMAHFKDIKFFSSKFVAIGALLSSLMALNGCAPYKSASIEMASEQVIQSLGCSDMKSLIFDSFYELVDQDQAIPSKLVVKENIKLQIQKLIEEKKFSSEEVSKLEQIENELNGVVDILLDSSGDEKILTWKELIQKMIELEMEDQSSENLVASQKELALKMQNISNLSAEAGVLCKAKPQATPPAPVQKLSLKNGIDHVVATAYQSCRVLDVPAIDNSTPDVQGITRLAENHPDGIGGKRVISDVKAVQKTHPYVKNIATESACARVRDNPLIYDYGGEPAITNGLLNLFKDAGTGTKALGVDCSAFVSTAIATAGFRYKPNLANKPIYVRQSSSKFIDAAKSGFTCFDNVTVTPKASVAVGDIVGIKGHVVVIDRLGTDPFGLQSIKKVEDCSRLNYKNFDMDIAQSSPSKNGIGINKFKIKDYLDETAKMQTAFLEMGKNACLAKFQNKNIKPKSTEWGFLRHKRTSECLATRVALSNESCTSKCFAK